MNAEKIIVHYNMEPLEEGGWWANIHRSDIFLPASLTGLPGERESVSAIYYLLKGDEFSKWHILRAQETWFHLAGGELEIKLGGSGERPVDGETFRLKGEIGHFHAFVPKDVWQTARIVDGDYVLVCCIVSPAFHDDDIAF